MMLPGILAFLVMLAYWPGISGAAVAPRWAVVAGCLLLVLVGPRLKLTTAHVSALLFAAWCAITLLWTNYPLDGVDALGRLILLAGAYCLGSQIADLRKVMIGAAIGLTVSSVVAIAQVYGIGLIEAPGPAGLFWNKNYLAEAAALVLIWALASRCWWLIPGLLPAVYLPQARGAWLAIAVTAVLMLWRRSRIAALAGGALALVLIGYAVMSVSLASGTERMAIWSDTASHLSLFGYGIGGFVENFPHIANNFVMATSRPGHAHNEYLQIAFETGLVGVALFSAFIGTLLRGELTPEKLVLIGLLVEAFLAFPFQLPATGFIGAVVAGRIAADRDHIRDAVAGRGVALFAWFFGRSRPYRRHFPC